MKKKDIEELKKLIRESNVPKEYKKIGAVKLLKMVENRTGLFKL